MNINVIVILSLTFVLSTGQRLSGETYSNSRKFPSQRVCGIPKMSLQTAIVGGRKAELGAYPWMANIGYTTQARSGSVRWLCGGTLITDRHVLTAAHCLHPSSLVEGKRPENQFKVVSVQLGDLDTDPKKQDGAAPQIFDVDKIIYHQQYSNKVKENDIGIVKLKKRVTFTDLIKPICLPPISLSQKDFVGERPTVAGWGANIEGIFSASDTHLMEVSVEVRDTEDCRRNVTTAPGFRDNVIDSKVICAASPGKDSCQGDSGGPLMYRGDSSTGGGAGNWFQIGIVSYGYGCAREGFPGVYAKVSSYMGWIDQNIDY